MYIKTFQDNIAHEKSIHLKFKFWLKESHTFGRTVRPVMRGRASF